MGTRGSRYVVVEGKISPIMAYREQDEGNCFELVFHAKTRNKMLQQKFTVAYSILLCLPPFFLRLF